MTTEGCVSSEIRVDAIACSGANRLEDGVCALPVPRRTGGRIF